MYCTCSVIHYALYCSTSSVESRALRCSDSVVLTLCTSHALSVMHLYKCGAVTIQRKIGRRDAVVDPRVDLMSKAGH